ncbi:MAG: acyltransferase [Crocinitomicaceae bacterium]|nr:acyltransferase [Crocinitomicaceae bacterium]
MKERLRELDALRGIAALLVVMFHYTMLHESSQDGWVLGVTGVDLFFIISGFVIFMSIERIKTPQDFLRRRFFRLFPVYWTIVTFTAILTYFNFAEMINVAPLTTSRYLSNLTMFQKLLGVQSIDGPYWTLLVEMQFYIIIAIALLTKRIKVVLIICSLFLGFLLFNELVMQPISSEWFEWLFFKADLRMPIIMRIPFFLAGILFYKLYKKEGNWMTMVGILACYITALLIFQSLGPAKSYISLPQYVFTTSIYFGVFILFLQNQLNFIVSPTTLFFGRISYSLYLIHQFLGINLIMPYLEKHYEIPYIQGAIISIAVSTLLAFIVTKYVEEPSIRYYRSKK